MIEQTLFIIKPNAVKAKHIGDIVSVIEREGFVIQKMKLFRFDDELASRFYNEHKGKAFYDKLMKFICSGDSVALLLAKENAIESLRELMGDVDPQKRKPGTLRAMYAESITENAVHGSDSVESARREIGIIFPVS